LRRQPGVNWIPPGARDNSGDQFGVELIGLGFLLLHRHPLINNRQLSP
jgi:hypothetical protein